VLDRITPAEVDRVLDPLVSQLDRGRGGVIYADHAHDGEVLSVAAKSCRVFASSETFRAQLSSRGIPFHDAADAELTLARLD